MALRRYVRLARDIWGCPKLRKLPLLARIVYVYLLDFPHETLTGIVLWDMDEFHYHFPYPEWNDAAVEKALAVLEQAGHIARDNGCIWLRNYTNEQGLRGCSIERGIDVELHRMETKSAKLVAAYVEAYPVYTPSTPRLQGLNKIQITDTEKTKIPESKKTPVVPQAKRVRPVGQSLSELEAILTPDGLAAWKLWAKALAAGNGSGTVAETRLASQLLQLTSSGLSEAAVIHGLMAHIGAGVDPKRRNPVAYVLAAARGYEERNP